MNERLSVKQWKWLWGGLAAVLIVAVFFRFWQIDSIPPGLFGDEGVCVEILHGDKMVSDVTE